MKMIKAPLSFLRMSPIKTHDLLYKKLNKHQEINNNNNNNINMRSIHRWSCGGSRCGVMRQGKYDMWSLRISQWAGLMCGGWLCVRHTKSEDLSLLLWMNSSEDGQYGWLCYGCLSASMSVRLPMFMSVSTAKREASSLRLSIRFNIRDAIATHQ